MAGPDRNGKLAGDVQDRRQPWNYNTAKERCVTALELAQLIDHTALKPETSESQIVHLCEEARNYRFWSVCVAPSWVAYAKAHLAGSSVKVDTVIGFPHGNTSSPVKAFEAEDAIRAGADELDLVLNIGLLKSGAYEKVVADIREVVQVARQRQGLLVKAIIETGLLTDGEKIAGAELAVKAGADFVKTSTGFGPSGATVTDVALLRRVVGPKIGVKASGGIRDMQTALTMVNAGATRLGSSSSVTIMRQFEEAELARTDSHTPRGETI
jgi:deoxyribose-phosphate aldolase